MGKSMSFHWVPTGNREAKATTPISAPGHQGRRGVRQAGFSLLEVLIVLAIIGIATTTISVGAFQDGDAQALRQDAVRLSQLFGVAQAQARKGDSPVVWKFDTQGYGFARAPRDLFLPTGLARQAGPVRAEDFPDTSSLRRRDWSSDNAIAVRIDPPAATVFNTEWISGPLAVELDDGTNTVRIVRSGNGQYRVRP
ncbi:type II secretion system protein GspH [Allopusillimonas ginsengisoli]|nr:type II secretion system protein GspH [Allopusillimonas ginsengisoli]